MHSPHVWPHHPAAHTTRQVLAALPKTYLRLCLGQSLQGRTWHMADESDPQHKSYIHTSARGEVLSASPY